MSELPAVDEEPDEWGPDHDQLPDSSEGEIAESNEKGRQALVLVRVDGETWVKAIRELDDDT